MRGTGLEYGNVRLVSAHGDDERWVMQPDDTAARERAIALLEEYNALEPDAGWRLETRGTIAGWHTWVQ